MIWKRDTEKWENMGRRGLTKPGGEHRGEGGVNGIGFLAKPWIREVSVTQQCPGEVRCLGTYLQAASQNREESVDGSWMAHKVILDNQLDRQELPWSP